MVLLSVFLAKTKNRIYMSSIFILTYLCWNSSSNSGRTRYTFPLVRTWTTSISLEHFEELIFTHLSSEEDPPHPSRALYSFGYGSINIIIIVPVEFPPVDLYKMCTLYSNQTTQRSHRLNSPQRCLEPVVSSHYIIWVTFNKMFQSPKTDQNQLMLASRPRKLHRRRWCSARAW